MQRSALLLGAEVKEIPQISKCGSIQGNVRIILFRFWVRQIVAAAIRDRRKIPVALDKLQDRHMVRIRVRNVAGLCVRRNHEQRDACADPEVYRAQLESSAYHE